MVCKDRIKISIDKRQWVLPLGFAFSKRMKSIYIFCIGIDFLSKEAALDRIRIKEIMHKED